MKYTIRYACGSNVGKIRNVNEDNLVYQGRYLRENTSSFSTQGVFTSSKTGVVGVFDGIGGEELGEIASGLAAKEAASMLQIRNPVEQLQDVCFRANAKICQYAAEHSVYAMGTTAAMLAFSADAIGLCNIGDSKIFHLSGDQFRQISVDHYAATVYGKKPPLSQNLGIPETECIIDPYLAKGVYSHGDLYLLCSDGLTDMVTQDLIKEIIMDTPFEEVVDELIQTALDAGGRDNITIVLCKIEKKQRFSLGSLFKH